MIMIQRVLGSLLWVVALAVLLGQLDIPGFDWNLIDYPNIVISLLAGYVLLKK